MLIGALAEQTQISRDTLRFYEKIGLIASKRRANGYKEFMPQTIDQLKFIKLAQQLGFSLQQIKSILPLLQAGSVPPALLRQQITDKLVWIDQQMAQLHALRQTLLDLPIGQDCPLQQHCVSNIERQLD
jgi:DNA-binding transcriptional MerR regulator